MPLLNTTVATANSVYQVSLIFLLLGAGLVLVSATALIWSNSIRERDTAQRLVGLGDVKTQAQAEVVQAEAEVAAAHKEVIAATVAAANVEKEIAEIRQPGTSAKGVPDGRQITAENCGLFINFVETVSKGRVVIEAISTNPEATQFAKQLSDMLGSAGYDVTENFGSTSLLGDQPSGVLMKIRSMADQPVYAGSLQRGLEFIGINTAGALDASAADAVILFIGSKQ